MTGDVLRCAVCRKVAPGALTAPELGIPLCMTCDADLVLWLADGGAPQEWPALEQARREAVAVAGLAARDRLRTRLLAPDPQPISPELRERAARGVAIIKARGGWTS